MNQEHEQSINNVNVNVNLMAESVTRIESGIMTKVDASPKMITYKKKIIFGILLHAAAKMINIQWLRVMKL